MAEDLGDYSPLESEYLMEDKVEETDMEDRVVGMEIESEHLMEDEVRQKETDPDESQEDPVEREVTIVVVGRSGAGKTSLIKKVLNLKAEATGLNPKHDTTRTTFDSVTRHGIKLNIIDTVGLSQQRKEKKKQLKKMGTSIEQEFGTEDKVDLLLFCLTVGPSSKFHNDNPQIMESLRLAYGRNIWRHCLVVFTFSNLAWDCVKDEPDAVNQYTEHITEYTNNFERELTRLGCPPDVKVNTIFECPKRDERPKHMIVTVPAGKGIHDPVLPGITLDEEGWVGHLFMEMVHSAKEESKRALLQFRYNREYLKKAFRNPQEYVARPFLDSIKELIQ